jgi:polyisoprenoid-binding protein YceI
VSGVITVAAAAIDTKNTRRDTHLRSADFFDSDNFPAVTFTAEGIRPSGQGVTVTGPLTVHDHSRPITFDATAAVHRSGGVALDAEVRIERDRQRAHRPESAGPGATPAGPCERLAAVGYIAIAS